jgi:hypothetical protein
VFVVLACIAAGLGWKHSRDLAERKAQIQHRHDQDLAQLDADVTTYNHVMQTAQATALSKDAVADDIKRIEKKELEETESTEALRPYPESYAPAADANRMMQEEDEMDIAADHKKNQYLSQQLEAQARQGLSLYKKFQANPIYLQQYKETSLCLDGATVVDVTSHYSDIPLDVGSLRFVEHR